VTHVNDDSSGYYSADDNYSKYSSLPNFIEKTKNIY